MAGMFSGSHWSSAELTGFLKKLEEMYASGIRDSSFKDQRLVFSSAEEIEQRISKVRAELERRGDLYDCTTGKPVGTGKKKLVRVTTRSKGF